MGLLLHGIEVLLVAAVVAVLGRGLRLGPAARHALWLVVLLKLLVPPFVAWPWSLSVLPAEGVRPAVDPPQAGRVVRLATASEEGPTAPHEPDATRAMRDDMFLSPNMDDERPAPVAPPRIVRGRLGEAAVAVWVCGGIAAALVQFGRLRAMRRRLRHAVPAPPALLSLVEEMAAALGVRAPAVAVSPGLGSPLVWAAGRTRLLWPEGLERQLSSDGCRAVLIHELAHLARRDHWVGRLLFVAGCVWWWHPLFYLVRRQLHRHAELACDARVIDLLPESRREYAEALLDVCQRQTWTAAAPALGAAGRRRDLERRLVMIMTANVPGRLSPRLLAGIGLLGLMVLPAWTASPAKPADKPAASAADRDKQLQELEKKLQAMLKEVQERRKQPSAEVPARVLVNETLYDFTTQPSEAFGDVTWFIAEPSKLPEDKKLQELEARVKALLKEVQELRAGKTTANQPLGVLVTDNQKYSVADIVIGIDAGIQSAPAEVNLVRTTYKLPAAKAEALSKFLQQFVKAPVMETKADGDSLTVTTTPEVQQGIKQFIALAEGKSPQGRIHRLDGKPRNHQAK